MLHRAPKNCGIEVLLKCCVFFFPGGLPSSAQRDWGSLTVILSQSDQHFNTQPEGAVFQPLSGC